MWQEINSLQNDYIKEIVSWRKDRRRQEQGLVVVEGRKEIEMALASGWLCQDILVSSNSCDWAESKKARRYFILSDAVIKKISRLDNPDGCLAVFQMREQTLGDLHLPEQCLLVVIDKVEKPGNIGAIARTAEAVGVDALIVSDQHTDAFNPNAIRASRGALFALPLVSCSRDECLSFLSERSIELLLSTPEAKKDYFDVDMKKSVALVVGTEHEGLDQVWLSATGQQVRIPMFGKSDSLNASVSAALLMYEALRQRRNAQK